MGINECVISANFTDPRSRDRELNKKNAIFGLKIY